MPPLPGVQTATWNGFAFAKWVIRARDNFGPSFFEHRIPHRNGALQERTGNIPFQVTYDLQFPGRTWIDDAKQFFNALLERPRGDLVHHWRGKVRAVVMPIDASWDPPEKGNLVTTSVSFHEDTLTNNASFDRTPGTAADDVASSTQAADENAALYVSDVFNKFRVGIPALQLRARAQAAQGTTSAFTNATREYAAAALSQFQAGQIQITLAAQLGRLPALLDKSIEAYRALPPVSPYSQVSMEYAEVSLNQARRLDASIRANLPPPIRWRIRQQTSLLTFVGRTYPTRSLSEKLSLVSQILLTNRITRPDAIAAGRVLVVPAP